VGGGIARGRICGGVGKGNQCCLFSVFLVEFGRTYAKLAGNLAAQ